MRSFACRVCGSQLFFENTVCVSCGTALGYSRAEHAIVPVDAEGRYVDRSGLVWHRCRNLSLSGCTWLAPFEGGQCFACGLTRTRPNDRDLEGLAQLPAAEAAKRHLVVELDSRGFDVVGRDPAAGGDPERGLAFDMLSSSNGEQVVIGHADGIVTIDVGESDPARREHARVDLGEPYRTMLGHVRHEVGHYVQWRLVTGGDDPALVERCRELFGDETADYQAAIERHYAEGPPAGWAASYISTYATMHPFEDFAETFAHYLHISDTCETAAEYGLLAARPEAFGSFRDLVRGVWIPLSVALNQINRSMGKDDLYPFVIPEPVLDKLELVAGLASRGPSGVR